jgi:PIN domain nuclease of toxin-antitoxin system
MKLLADTHILMWAAIAPEKLSMAAATALKDESNQLFYSAASIWEVAIKSALHKTNFNTDARVLYRGLLDAGYIELPVTSEHAAMAYSLPLIHKDPFDRILIAQATVEGITLLTSDRQIAKYPGPIRKV